MSIHFVHLVHFGGQNMIKEVFLRFSTIHTGLENNLLTKKTLIGHVAIGGFDTQKVFQ